MDSGIVERNKLEIKYGKPIYNVTFHALTFMYNLVLFFLSCSILLAVSDMDSAVELKRHFGYFINMVSEGDGNLLPALQAFPACIYLLLNLTQLFLIIKIFQPSVQINCNRYLFVTIICSILLLIFIFVILMLLLSNIYQKNNHDHNGFMLSMYSYSNNSLMKRQIDQIQIELECCGNKKYDDWYNISWYDKSIATKGSIDDSNGNTPFSCCSRRSLTPCIHHDIESTGKAYLYAPERNLSISTTGCYDSIVNSKQRFAWEIFIHLIFFGLLQVTTIILLRFLQTAHFSNNAQFDRQKLIYTIWLVGIYRGKIMVPEDAPDPPPVPPEFMK